MKAVAFTLIPLLAMFVGAMATMIRPPSRKARSGIQHFAAGIVFAAAASEILPDVKHGGSVVAVAIGAAIGILLMLLIKQLGQRAAGPFGIAAVTGIDILVDGLVLGIAFAAGTKQGWLLTIALTLEVLFLGLTLTGRLAETVSSRWKAVVLASSIGLALPVGAVAVLSAPCRRPS